MWTCTSSSEDEKHTYDSFFALHDLLEAQPPRGPGDGKALTETKARLILPTVPCVHG
jgi:hypothetical protein